MQWEEEIEGERDMLWEKEMQREKERQREAKMERLQQLEMKRYEKLNRKLGVRKQRKDILRLQGVVPEWLVKEKMADLENEEFLYGIE